MGIFEFFLIGIGLAMDAFAVAICKGVSIKKLNWNQSIIVGTYFGMFQAGMPVIGYILGLSFENLVRQIDHWITFILLTAIGINMIKQIFSKGQENHNDKIDAKTMIVLALATSIDALAVGIAFAFFDINIWYVASIIGIITFVLSFIGVKIGNNFGKKYEKKAELFGGIILILMGIKIMLEHLGILNI